MSAYDVMFFDSGGHTFTISDTANQRMRSRTLDWTENYPRKLTLTLDNRTTVPAENFLSSSYAGWDVGTGALDIGIAIMYSVYPTATNTRTEVFWGMITELSQSSDGILTITAKDLLEKYEYLQPNGIVFKNYRDGEIKDTTEGVGARTIDGCTETGIVWPAVRVGVATTDMRTTLSGVGTNKEYLMISTIVPDAPDTLEYWYPAQAFVACGDGLIGVKYEYQTQNISVVGHIQCRLQADVEGYPSGVDIAVSEYQIALGTEAATPRQVDFTDELASKSVAIEKGQKYWIVFSCDDTIRCTEDAGGFVAIIYHTGVAALPYTDHYWWKLHDGAWTESAADRNLTLILDFADYTEIISDDYYVSGTTIVTNTNGIPITPIDTYYHLHRGKVSYYYGTVTTGEIFTKLTGYDTEMTASIDADCNTTFSLYQTRGKSVGECFRELCDTFETTGARSGYQHVITAYNDDVNDIVQVGFKTNPDGRTFSHGADSTTDDELRIVSINLKRTTTQRPASVIVIGKAASGAPIIVQRDDGSLGTSSFRTKSRMQLMTTLTDESINTLVDADRKAWQILDSFARDTWEGTVIVAGVFPDLFDLSVASESYGAGGHIHLKYSPLGINNVEFHVRGFVLHENTTEIQISNDDLLLLNALTEARGRAERSESFLAPDDPFTTAFVSGYTPTITADASLYMVLRNGGGGTEAPIAECHRILATKMANTRWNTNVYHAEFETDNGHTIDGTDLVTNLIMYDAPTGGAVHAGISLSTSLQFPKWRTTRVIAEIRCKAS